jgi:hypothetical protein
MDIFKDGRDISIFKTALPDIVNLPAQIINTGNTHVSRYS